MFAARCSFIFILSHVDTGLALTTGVSVPVRIERLVSTVAPAPTLLLAEAKVVPVAIPGETDIPELMDEL